MKLYVNEKLFSIRNKFYVKNESGDDVFEISSQIISIGDKTTIRDMKGNEIVYIEQELFHFTPNYKIYINNNLQCKITKKFQLLKNDYIIDNGYRVEGDIFSLDFEIYDKENNKIGNVARKFFSIGDQYEIDIHDEKDVKMVLAIVVAIANDINRKQRNND